MQQWEQTVVADEKEVEIYANIEETHTQEHTLNNNCLCVYKNRFRLKGFKKSQKEQT